jgi:type IV pilus assembly protein PilP
MRQIMHAGLERAIVFIFFALVVLTSCQDQPEQAVAPEPAVVSVPIPQKQETAIPQKQETAISQKQETAIPQKQETAIPQKQETAISQKQETAIPQKQETAISQKQETAIPQKQETAIPQKQETAISQKQETAIPQKQEVVIAGIQEAVIPTKQEIPMAANRETATSTLKDVAPPEKPAVSSSLSQPEEKPLVTEPAQPQFYSAKGKIDPFLPLIRTEQKAVAVTDAREKKPQRVLTPLEKLDLSQIRLVAVVLAESGNLAMVEETSGKGYVVRIGTYIGKNEGRVEKILTDRIVIKEIVKNFRGDTVPRSREMKLHKQEFEG